MKHHLVTVILILFNFKHTVLGQATFTVCRLDEGSSCRLDCKVTPASSATFRLSGQLEGSCIFANNPNSCSSTNYNITQTGDSTYLDITSLDFDRDNGTWTCENNVQNKDADLIVLSRMQDISLTFSKTERLSEGETVNVTAEMKCQYPIDSFTGFSLYKKEKMQSNSKEIKITTSFSSYNSTTAGCRSHELNIKTTFSVSSSEACGETQMYGIFTNAYLGSKNGSLSSSMLFPDYNWHILIGWVIGIFIIPIAGFVFFMFQFVMKKHSGGSNKKCDGKSKECKILVGVGLGVAVGLSLIICIIIATQVCLSKMGTALGIGIGVSFGIMFISVIIIAIIFFTCMKEKPDGDDSKPTTDKSEEINGKNNQIAPEKNKSNKPNKKAATFNNAKPIMQDKPKNKALDEVPKGRQLPSPRNDVEENKIRLPTKLPPLNHEENSTSSPKKKKKKRKSKENENEDKSE